MYKTDDVLMHYGVKRRSGRYPWGSGDSPYQHSGDFLSAFEEYKKQGLTNAEIAKLVSTDDYVLTSTDLAVYAKVARHERRALTVARAESLRDDGLNPSEIGREMGIRESSVRSLLNEGSKSRMNKGMETANALRDIIEEKGAVDIGGGIEYELGITRGKLEEAIVILEGEGYNRYGVGVKNSVKNSSNQTTIQCIAKKDITYGELYKDPSKIKTINDYHFDEDSDGKVILKEDVFHYPTSIDSKRVQIRYSEDGGLQNDGVIELRKGVEDISLGNSAYAQVRILVDGTHYMKGMAVYSDNLPDGVDIIYNSNKKRGTPFEDCLKEVKPEHANQKNPFGTYIKEKGQRWYDDPVTGERKLSAINMVKEEGDWDTWSRNLPSQFLSKQNLSLIKKQLNLSYSDKLAEYEEIRALENPTLRKSLLNDFADSCDSAAVHLKAASLPGQTTKVILPTTKLSDKEVYAPTYQNGEKVALVRYPHEGTFEIPVLTVNNKKELRDLYGNLEDAIAINDKVAGHLSGADFDGDTVTVIPLRGQTKISAKKMLPGLEGFEPKDAYGPDKVVRASESPDGKDHYYRKGVEISTNKNYEHDMGTVSNLITDMTLKGAPDSEVEKATRFAMTIIDTKKHPLDYKACYVDNDIATLKNKWQGHVNPETGNWSVGAGTLISRASAQVTVPKRKGNPNVNPETGEKTYKEVTYVDKNGVVRTMKSKEVDETYTYTKTLKNGTEREYTKKRTSQSTQMAETNDAFTLSSGHAKENAYAAYANSLKTLAMQARKEALNTGRMKVDPEAKKKYAAEIESMDKKIEIANLNRPRERQAQIYSDVRVKNFVRDNPEHKDDKKMLGKIKAQALDEGRKKMGASGKDTRIDITPKEWEAIQAGAFSDSKLQFIFKKGDAEQIRAYATPKTHATVTEAKQGQIKALSASGYTIGEISEKLGFSPSTISKYIK